MDNFDLKKYLIENKRTTPLKPVNEARYSDSYDSEASQQIAQEEFDKKQLETIAKDAVSDVGEQLSCENEGRCAHISKEIHKKLNKLGIKNDIIEVLSGYIGKEEKESNVRHYYVFIYEGNIIVDTQLWQINQQPKNLDKRKVVFTYEEYQKYFRPTETNKIS